MDTTIEAVSDFANGSDLRAIIAAAIILVIITIVSHLLTKLIRRVMQTDGVALPSATILVNIGRIVVWVVGLSIMLSSCFGVDMNALLAALGVGGIAVSLGLQDTIKNFIGGLQVTLMGIVKPGDHVLVEGVEGIVQDVNWRQTTMRDKDNNYHVIPNSALTSGMYVHLRGKMARRYVFECDIKPGLDLPRVAGDIECLADEALDDCGWRSSEHTEVRFIGSTANGVRTSIRIFLKDIEYTTRSMDVVMRAIGQRGYLADWTNENPIQEQWR